MSTETITTTYTINRMPSSADGNPRYELIDESGERIGSTRPDSNLAHGKVPNHEGRLCEVHVHETPTGRRYITNVIPL